MSKRIGIDEWLRVPSVQDVFAVGDCSGYLESTGKTVLPALAQVSHEQLHLFQKPSFLLARNWCWFFDVCSLTNILNRLQRGKENTFLVY